MLLGSGKIKVFVRTGVKLGVDIHTRRHVVDVTEGTCPEIAGLNKQNFQARREDGKFLCETFHSSYMETSQPGDLVVDKM